MKVCEILLCATPLMLSPACHEPTKTNTQSISEGGDVSQMQRASAKKLQEQPFRITSGAADSCRGGYEFEFTALTSTASKRFEFSVHQLSKSAHPDTAFSEIEARIPANSGRRLVGVINGGFFNDSNGEPYSYFQSAPPWLPQTEWKKLANKGTLPKPSQAGLTLARPCLEWLGTGYLPRFFLPREPRDWKERDANPTQNILCAGPLLLENASSVASTKELRQQLEESSKIGGFTSDARADRGDPLSFDQKQARTASCIKQNGDFLIFAKFPDACGISLPELQQKLFKLGCKTAMAHDGGTSVQYTFYAGPNHSDKRSTSGRYPNISRHRQVPVWLAVSLLNDN